MSIIKEPTVIRMEGPWYLNEDHLKQLDRIIDECWGILRDEFERDVKAITNQEISERMDDGLSREQASSLVNERLDQIEQRAAGFRANVRSTTLYLAGGRTAHGISFSELMKIPHSQDEVAKGFSIHLRIGSNTLSLSLSGGTVRAEADCPEYELSQRLFGLLQNWISDVAPPKWQQTWLEWGGLIVLPIALISIIFLLIVWFAAIPRSPNADYKEEARNLVRQGINPSNQAKAIELLLAMESGYTPNQTHQSTSHTRFWTYMIACLAIILLLPTCPKDVIGMWAAGRKSYNRTCTWIKFVTWSTPIYLLTTFFLPRIFHALGW